MALNQVGTLPRNVHSPSGTIKLRLSEFSYLETQPGSSSTRPLNLLRTHKSSFISKVEIRVGLNLVWRFKVGDLWMVAVAKTLETT